VSTPAESTRHQVHQEHPLPDCQDARPEIGIFNLTNTATVQAQNYRCGPNLNRVQAILDGRVVRLGVQADFQQGRNGESARGVLPIPSVADTSAR
jgi:hypothetical protein